MDSVNTSGLWLAPLNTAVFAIIQQSVDEFLEENGVDGRPAYNTRLVIEEIIRNLIQHTPPYSTDETAEIVIEVTPQKLTVIVSDTRPPFDPSAAPPLDTDATLADRPPGGMGIHLVRNLVDELTYGRDDDRNRLTAVLLRE